MNKQEAAYEFQTLLLRNGAMIIYGDPPDLIDSDSERNVFNYDNR